MAYPPCISSHTGILPAERPNPGDELRHAGHRVFFALVFGGHITLEPRLCEKPPDAIHIHRRAVIKAIADVSIGCIGDAGCDLSVSVFCRRWNEMSDIQIN